MALTVPPGGLSLALQIAPDLHTGQLLMPGNPRTEPAGAKYLGGAK